MQSSFRYGDITVPYSMTNNHSLQSRVRIHVLPDGKVQVETPPDKPMSEISQAVHKRARWITQQLHNITTAKKYALPREYVSGETHFYLGKRYQLKLVNSSTRNSSVKLKGGQIHITAQNLSSQSVRSLLNKWYRARAQDYLSKRVNEVSPRLPWVENEPPIKLLKMKTQWGSCSPSGTIVLNPHLIRAPRECIDYVITHELCHLLEHNHSKRFYTAMDQYFPKWEKVKFHLDGIAELLLVD